MISNVYFWRILIYPSIVFYHHVKQNKFKNSYYQQRIFGDAARITSGGQRSLSERQVFYNITTVVFKSNRVPHRIEYYFLQVFHFKTVIIVIYPVGHHRHRWLSSSPLVSRVAAAVMRIISEWTGIAKLQDASRVPRRRGRPKDTVDEQRRLHLCRSLPETD